MSAREMEIAVPGGKVRAWLHGCDRPEVPLLALHGGPGAPHDYLEPLAALAGERPVIFYDQLGCGASERPGDRSLWTLERSIEELAAVRSALGLERLHLLGQSWGALLAATYLLRRRPEGVASLILSGPLLSAPRWMSDQRRLLAAMPEEIRAAVSEAEQSGNFESPDYQAAMLAYYKRHLCRLEPWPDCLNRTFDGMGTEVYLTMWGPSEFTATGNLRQMDMTPHLGGISIPAMITAGRYDEATPETAAFFQKRVRGSRLVIFEDASHAHHLECASHFLAAVRDFLGGV